MKQVYSLKIETPFSAVDAVFDVLPEDTLGQSGFKKNADDRSENPLWVVEGIYAVPPDETAISVRLEIIARAQSHAPYRFSVESLPTQGWLARNEESYAPIRIGKIIIHGPRQNISSRYAIALPIGAAFGTGEHPTTHGCLMALQQAGMLKRGARVLDVGTGSGILALAAAKLAHAKVVAGEIEAESVAIARENVHRNGARNLVRVEKAEGCRHRVIARGKPYDVIVSNIFAKPLAKLAPAMRKHLKPGGRVVLAGFLHRDSNLVRSAYAAQRIYVERQKSYGAWRILILRRPVKATKV
ncbi:MAG TPA: 50S ribosomal protein L11 methyltransferase [Alphaproteobacteria bacterium]|nr:50S ribosomal protein L11 methyltransferase [Alphaproteobacteria bacterium]